MEREGKRVEKGEIDQHIQIDLARDSATITIRLTQVL